MKVLFITQIINPEHDDLGFVILWINEFIRQGFEVEVIALESRNFDNSFLVHSLGKERGAGRIVRTLRFLKLIMTLKYDRVFVHMNSEYFTVGGWWWWLMSKPMYMWYTHYTLPIHTRVAARLCKRMFAATPQSLPQFDGNPKKVVTGHGIDLSFWDNAPERAATNETALLAVHRICRSKRIERTIHALTYLPSEYTLTVYGRDVEKDYLSELEVLVQKLSLEGRVTFMGPVPPPELKQIYPRHRLMVNMAYETIDKTMLECMLYGTFPVVSPRNAEAMGLGASPVSDEPEDIASFIQNGAWRAYDIEKLRLLVQEQHSLSALIKKMGEYIRKGN